MSEEIVPNFLYNNKSKREQARVMFLSDHSVTATDISQTFGISIDEARFFIYGKDGSGKSEKSWHLLRQTMTDSAIIAVMANQRDVVEHTGKVALDIIMRTLNRVQKEVASADKELSIQDLKDISDIFTKMDKIVRLDDGMATEIRHNFDLTPYQKSRIGSVMASDPFTIDNDIEEVEYVELEDADE